MSSLQDQLRSEYRRICPDEHEVGGFSFYGVNPGAVLQEWRAIPDGAGETAIAEALDRILVRLLGPDSEGSA